MTRHESGFQGLAGPDAPSGRAFHGGVRRLFDMGRPFSLHCCRRSTREHATARFVSSLTERTAMARADVARYGARHACNSSCPRPADVSR